jgi:hypothetical protein
VNDGQKRALAGWNISLDRNQSAQETARRKGTAIYAGGPAPWTSLPNVTQTFGYDGLSRLTAASESGGWAQTCNYDEFANMLMAGTSGLPVNGAMPTTNVYSASGAGNNRNPNATYDAAGNQTVFGALGISGISGVSGTGRCETIKHFDCFMF